METLQRTANRGSISTGYDIDNSLKLEADNGERIQRVYSGQSGSISSRTPTSTKIATISFWIKRTELQPSGNHLCFIADANFTWVGFNNDGLYILGSTAGINLRSNSKFRDTSAWYHIVVAFDTTQSTASNRVKVYVNGEQWTEWGVSSNYGVQNNDIDLYDVNTSHYLGWSDAQSQSGYYAEFYLIDGQQLAPTEFGEFDSDSGIWKPKAYGGTFGNQGYHLDFEDSSALGADVSGNGNNFTGLYNITSADQATDTPTNNFCTWNPLWAYQYQPTIKEGATVAAYGDSTDENAKATVGLTNGKWYWEAKPSGTIGSQFIGISTDGDSNISSGQGLTQNYQMTIEPQGRYYSYAGSLSESSAGQFTALTTSDTLGIALDMDSSTQTIKYYANGSLILTRDLITEMQGRTVFPFLQNYESRTFNINFGGYTINTISSAATDENGYGTFEHAPPSGYYALCTKNLAEYG